MQTSKKIIVGLVLSLSVFAGSSVVHASYNWKDFFSFNEMSSIKKATNTSIINNFKNDSDWKNIIGGKNIKDGAITDEKVASSAALNGTKIHPNFGSQNIITTGNIGIGTDDPNYKMTVVGDAYISGHTGIGTATDSDTSLNVKAEAGPGEAATAIYGLGGNLNNGNASWIRGVMGQSLAVGGGVIDNAVGLETNIGANEGSTITNGYGVYIGEITSGLAITNKFGLYQEGSADTNYFAGNIGIGTSNPTEKLDINSDSIRIRTDKTPVNATDTCAKGEISWDSGYMYVCVATNTWKRSTLSTW